MMGGDVTVTSELGEGSVFTVRLPGSADGPHRALLSDDATDHHECVLVIDDDATARELISDHLRQADGFTAVTAAGGLEGLRRAKELHPSAITLDVMMPDIDGWTVISRHCAGIRNWPTFPS